MSTVKPTPIERAAGLLAKRTIDGEERQMALPFTSTHRAFDRRIPLGAAREARRFQRAYPVINRLLLSSPTVEFATQPIPLPTRVAVPTRFGAISALVYAPTPEAIETARLAGHRPPVHMLIHGGAFILQRTDLEGNIARYLASELGCYVVMPDYRAAPQVHHPVAEQECFDTYLWIRTAGAVHGWDPERVTVGGPSTGGHFSLAVALQAIDGGYPLPLALSVEFAPVDLALTETDRPYLKRRPRINRRTVSLVRRTYFAQADDQSGLASPIRHPHLDQLPPTLIMTAGLDTLRPELDRFAGLLAELGVEVTHRVVQDVDHGFLAAGPAWAARLGAQAIADHLQLAFRGAT